MSIHAPVPSGGDLRLAVLLDPSRPVDQVVDIAVSVASDRTLVELVSVDDGTLPDVVIDAFLTTEREQFADVRMVTTCLPGPEVVGTLLRHLVATRPDLVVLASHGRGPLGELLLGSVSADLIRSSPVPTLLVGPACDAAARLERLVVAVDGSPDALAAMHVADRLSARFGLPLELVEVAQDVPFGSDIAESAELHRLAASVDPPVGAWDVLHGSDVSKALIDHIGGDRGAALVLGSHGRSPGRPHVLGGTAARTVRHAPVPVLVVSPEAAATASADELVASRP